MVFNGRHSDPKFLADLPVGQILGPAHEEYAARLFWQAINRLLISPLKVRRLDRDILLRLDHLVSRFVERKQDDVVRVPAARPINQQIACDPRQKGGRICEYAGLAATGCAREHLLDKIRRLVRARPTTKISKKPPSFAAKRFFKRRPCASVAIRNRCAIAHRAMMAGR